MNDSSKKILFNKSTLFSLKAELLRKQDEVNEKKQLPKHKLENFKLPPTAKAADHEKIKNREHKKTFKDSLKAVDSEELEACRKAKLVLEKKTELYEHLSDKVGSSQLAGKFLVDFDTKKKEEASKYKPKPVQVEDVNEHSALDNEDEWTEFTDCLGRSRKCHKSDLEMFIKRDQELVKVMTKTNSINDGNSLQLQQDSNAHGTEKPLLVQTTNDYLQSLRDKWQKKEQELLAKDKDIHYQDLLFDEARIHGVGYYSFSTDETERRKQMEELIKRREETLKAQQEAEITRKKRDEMMAARVAAARARQRERAGLPPEEPKDSNQKDFTTCLLEFLTQQKNDADAKATEEERKVKEEQEKERQKLREAYVREWDIGKEGVEGKFKKFREMTQEEYVELQRSKRINEFAPPQTSASSNTNVFDLHGKILNIDDLYTDIKLRPKTPLPVGDLNSKPEQIIQKTWADVRPKVKTPPPPNIGDVSEIQKGLYFSTSKKNSQVKYRNFVKSQESVPILDELCNSLEQECKRDKMIGSDLCSTEIAPPPTYEYYGPTPKKKRYEKPFESDIREAYAQGAKSLEAKSSNRKLPQHYDFTFD